MAAGVLAALPFAAAGQDFTFTGSAGLLTVPTAETTEPGKAVVGANTHNPYPDSLRGVRGYFASIGFWPGLEVAGRVVDGKVNPSGGIRDLSLNLKYRLLELENGLSFALGAQDLGGEAQNFRSQYVVATWPWQRFSTSIGYGRGPDVLEGTFGGLEWKPWPYLSFQAEHDTRKVNGGIKLGTGPALGEIKATLALGYSGSRDDLETGLTISLPLGRSWKSGRLTENSRPIQAAQTASQAAPSLQTAPADVRQSPPPSPPPPPGADLQALAADLVALGFESVRVGLRPDSSTVVVVIENRVYNHSFVDAVGAALAAAAARLSSQTLELTLTSYGVPQLRVSVPAAAYREFLAGGDAAVLQRSWQVSYANAVSRPEEIQWQRTVAPMRAIEIIVEPVLRTFVATEYGVLDYGVGVRSQAIVPLARGLIASMGLQAPVLLSDDFRDGRNFADFGPEAGLDQLLVQYFHKPAPQWASLWSVGRTQIFQADIAVLALEQLWLSDAGRHQLRAKLMSFDAKSATRTVALGGYTWFSAERDLALSLTAGRFYAGENGFRLEANRYFGDTIVGLFFRAASRDDQVVGLQVSLPLTPRRDARPGAVQLKGSRRWAYGLSTTVNDAEGRNPLKPLLVYEPTLNLDLRRDFFDAERLSPQQLQSQTPRVLDTEVRPE